MLGYVAVPWVGRDGWTAWIHLWQHSGMKPKRSFEGFQHRLQQRVGSFEGKERKEKSTVLPKGGWTPEALATRLLYFKLCIPHSTFHSGWVVS